MKPADLSDHVFRRLFDLAPIGLALCDAHGKLLAVNEAYASIIGRTVAETLGLSYWNITPRRYESQEADLLESLRKTGLYGPYEKEYIHRDGHLVPVRLTLRSIKADGKSFIWAVVEDLSQERYRILFREALMGLTLRRMSGELVAVNRAFASLLGGTIEDLLKPGRYLRITPEEYHAQEAELLEKMIGDVQYGPYDKEYFHKSGRRIPVQLNGVRLEIGNSHLILSVVERGIIEAEAVDLKGSSGIFPAQDFPAQDMEGDDDENRPIVPRGDEPPASQASRVTTPGSPS